MQETQLRCPLST